MDVTVKILKWEKHQRKDVKRPSWFAFDNRMVEDEKFDEFTGWEFKAWCVLLSRASEKQNHEIQISLIATHKRTGVPPHEFISAIDKLVALGIVTADVTDAARARHADVTPHYITLQTLQDTTGQDTTPHDNSPRGKTRKPRTAKPPAPEGTGEVIGLYRTLWSNLYGARAVIRGKEIGLLEGLVHDVGRDRALELVRTYLGSREAWFVTKRHDVVTLTQNLGNVVILADTGRSITRTEIQQIDKQQTNQNTLDAVRRGEI